MHYSSDDEHDEDDLPVISSYVTSLRIPSTNNNQRVTTIQKNDENLLQRFQSNSLNRSLESYKKTYEQSIQHLRDDDDDDDDEYLEEEDVKDFRIPPYQPQTPVRVPPARATSTPARVPYLIQSPSSTPAIRSRSPSPPPSRPLIEVQRTSQIEPKPTYEQKPVDSKKNQSKWEVRSPQLLSVIVGPDRQSLEKTRRHTTEIVYQKANSKADDFYLSNSSTRSNGVSEERVNINPLVKQLRQKFDRLAETTTASISVRNPPTIRRVLSLTGRGTDESSTTGQEWSVKPANGLLPRRPAPEMKTNRTNSNTTLFSNGRSGRTRAGPPISFPKQYIPPPSTLTVVKQLIDSGATLVYDSSDKKKSNQTTTNSLYKFPSVNLNERIEHLKESDVPLTGRQLTTTVDEDDYATISPQIRKDTHNDIDPLGKDSSRRTSHSETSTRRMSANNIEDTAYYAVFEMKP